MTHLKIMPGIRRHETGAAPEYSLLLTCVVDNKAHEPFCAEHGQSIFIEYCGRNILFDTGQTGDCLINNLKHLNIDIHALEGVILSHGHYDHGGGLETLIQKNPGLRLFAHPLVFGERFNDRRKRAVNIGIRSSIVDTWLSDGHFISVETSQELLPGMITSGPVPDFNSGLSTGFSRVSAGTGNAPTPDEFIDEQFVLIRPEHSRDWVMINGCCHRGLLNSLDHAQNLTGIPVTTIAGGFHLSNYSSPELDSIWFQVREKGVLHLLLNHCTGDLAVARAQHAGFQSVDYFTAGFTAVISAS